jgi:hypothetical protein
MFESDRVLKVAKAMQSNKEDKDKLQRAYLKLYQEEWGNVILADLYDFCGQDRTSVCEKAFDNNQTNFAEGKRRVWLHIDRLITEAKDGLD